MVRFLPSLAVLLLAIVVTWNIARSTAPQSQPTQALTATNTAATTPTLGIGDSAAKSPTPGMPHRLAGTVVGDLSYAIVEAPDGTNGLYSIDEFVHGVGKLVAVGPKSATFEGPDGRFEMKLLAAPAPTQEPRRPDPVDDIDADIETDLEAEEDMLTGDYLDEEFEEDFDEERDLTYR